MNRCLSVLWFGLCCFIPLAASAQTPSLESISEARRDSAKTKYQAGAEAFRARRFTDAVQLFLAADALAPSAALSFNIALAYENLGDERAALRWFRDYLRRDANAPNAALVQNKTGVLARILAAQGVQQLSVITVPRGATLFIDRQDVGVTPITLELRPGNHHIHLHLEGYNDQNSEIILPQFEPKDFSFQLTPRVQATRISADERTRQTPANLLKTTPEDRQTARFGILPWIPTGVGAATLGLAIGFEAARRSEESKAKRATSQLEFKEHLDSMATDKQTARVLGSVGGALVITGCVLFLFNAEGSQIEGSQATRIGLGCGKSGCGVLAKGSF